jgi:hypothetical protein
LDVSGSSYGGVAGCFEISNEPSVSIKCVGGRIILKRILNKLVLEGMDWMFLAQVTEEWRAVLKSVMNLRVP